MIKYIEDIENNNYFNYFNMWRDVGNEHEKIENNIQKNKNNENDNDNKIENNEEKRLNDIKNEITRKDNIKQIYDTLLPILTCENNNSDIPILLKKLDTAVYLLKIAINIDSTLRNDGKIKDFLLYVNDIERNNSNILRSNNFNIDFNNNFTNNSNNVNNNNDANYDYNENTDNNMNHNSRNNSHSNSNNNSNDNNNNNSIKSNNSQNNTNNNNNMNNIKIIIIEGLTGSGKSTLINNIKKITNCQAITAIPSHLLAVKYLFYTANVPEYVSMVLDYVILYCILHQAVNEHEYIMNKSKF